MQPGPGWHGPDPRIQGVQTYMSKSQRILRWPVKSLPVVLSLFSTACGMPFMWLKYEPESRHKVPYTVGTDLDQ